MKARPLFALLGVLFTAEASATQALGEIARQEAERRERATPGKRYTNDDLRREPASGGSSPSQQTPSGPAAAPQPRTAPAAMTGTSDAPTIARGRPKRDEAYWRGLAREVRGRRGQLREQVESLQTRVVDLDAQLQAGAAPSVAREHDVAASALDRLQQEARFLDEEVARFEARARRDTVPPEWIR